MYWKRAGKNEYLIRTSPSNSQKSLGPKSAETEAIHQKFVARKVLRLIFSGAKPAFC